MKSKLTLRALLVLGASLLVACSDSKPTKLTLLDAPAESRDPEAERMRQMQAITIFNTVTKLSEEKPRLDIHRFAVAPACSDTTKVPSGCSGVAAGTCAYALCSAAADACVAKTFLALTKPQATPPVFGTWAIPLQKPAAIVDMADWALGYAVQAADEFARQLESMSGAPRFTGEACGTSSASVNLGSTSSATFAAAGFKELYDVYREAVATKIQAALDTSDAELNSSSSLALASQRSIVNWRLGVAAVPAGGTAVKLPLADTGAFCTTSPPREQARAAIAILRDAAIPPDDLFSATTTSNLLNATTAVAPNGSVRQRMAQFYGKPELLNTTTVPRMEDYYNLDISAFEDARKILKEEITAFSRSRQAKLTRRTLPDGTLATIDSYAGIASIPSGAPAAYYGALARTNDTTLPLTTRAYVAGSSFYNGATAGFNSDIEGFFGAAKNLVNVTKNLPLAIRDAASAPVGMLVADTALLGHVGVSMGATTYEVDVYGYASTDNIRLARGEDALRCALYGNVEGAPCKVSSVNPDTATLPAGTYPLSPPTGLNPVPHFGYTKAAYFLNNVGTGSNRFYLLKPKASAGTTPVEGEYEAVIGFTIVQSKPYAIFSIVRGGEDRLAEILAPSRDWCARPRLTCDGVEFDERIPLENELASDGDGVESSWKHYLQLAKDAAARADLLGAEYIGAGLSNASEALASETRQQQQAHLADSYLERLQSICGTQVDTRVLLSKLKDASGLNLQTTGGTCLQTSDCTTGHKAWSCQQSRCVLDIGKLISTFASQDPDTQRLSDCLSQAATTPFISLGNAPLCLWYDQANKNLVCSGAIPGQCPSIKPAGAATCPTVTLPPTVTTPQVLAESVPLGFFDTSQDGGTTAAAIDLYRTVANGALQPESWRVNGEAIRASNILDPFRLFPFAQRLDWEARFGGFAAITLDGATIWESGSPWTGPKKDVWPCKSLAAPAGPNAFAPLRDCSDVWQRELANQEMLRAVIAAKFLAGTYKSNIEYTGGHALGNLGGSYSSFDTIDLGTLPFKGACGGTADARDSFAYYRAGEGIIRTSTDKGQSYSFLAANLFAYSPRGGAICFKPGTVRNQGGGLSISSGLYAGGGAGARGPISDYLNGDALLGPDKNEVNKVAWETELDLSDVFTPTVVRRDFPLVVRDYLTAYQILAGAAQQPIAVTLTAPPKVQSVDDLESVAQYLSLLAQSIRSVSGRSLFSNIPDKVRDALRSESATGAFPQFGGEMAKTISAARGALLRIQENGPLISNEVQQMGYDMREVKALLQKSEIRKDISKLQFMSTLTQQLSNCATSLATAPGIEPVSAAGRTVAAAITCANSVAQIGFAQGIADLTAMDAKLDGDLAITSFGAKFAQHATSLQTLSLRLAEGQEDLDTALAQIDTLRLEATTQVSSALYAASEQAAHQAEVTNVTGNLYAGKQLRYQAALSNARRMAFLAKRAIEQRLGVRLAEMTEDLPLVEAPQKWEATACTFAGVDYSALKVTDGAAPYSYANGFIGDYVTKLENVIESYRLQHDFHEGSDTAVISLRDDIFGVHAKCQVQGANLLYDAGQLDRTMEPGWSRQGCATEVVDGVTVPKTDCITVKPLATAGPTFTDPTTSAVTPYTVTFGVNATSTLAGIWQSVDVEPGIYRFSWYTNGATNTGGAAAGSFFTSGATGAVTSGFAQGNGPTVNGWYRYYYRVKITKAGQIKFGFRKPASGIINIAAPMLERLSTTVTTDDVGFVPFVNTGATLLQRQAACQDSDGSVFRSTRWNRNCLKLCPDGFGEECEGDRAKSYCYWQTDFNINQRDIQQGRVFNYSGFARGNYNYRVNDVAINFVGTPRDCADSSAPEACFSAGFVPYSLAHVGPFVVRNHLGIDVPANLFDGNIEHARGLALERYITNPLSEADHALLGQYTRKEFAGRPLDGNFVVRVWEEPGVDFGAIQDVQIVLNYSYWTKFN
jgi:hypothetical protein